MTDPVQFAGHDYKVMGGSVGPEVVDIRKFYADTGKFTYDPGFTSTASCQSKLTYIDGDEGVLLHRGYSIGELAEQSSFMEVSYLLLNGELPSKAELDRFSTTITRHTMVHEQLAQFFRGFRRDALKALARVPYGETVTYSELARRAGRPRAQRAAGSACGSNPIPIVVPCHRIVRSDGALGNYLGGPDAKATLLALERGLEDPPPPPVEW